MTCNLDDLRQLCAQHDTQINARFDRLMNDQEPPKRRASARRSAPAWVSATPRPEAAPRSIMDGLQTYRGYVTAPHKTGKGKGITVNPHQPAPDAPPVDPARAIRDAEIRAMAAKGRTHRDIAVVVGTSVSTVGRVLRQPAA